MLNKSFLKGLILGLTIAVFSTNVVFAATPTRTIKVVFENVKLIFDGVQKKPANDSMPITYNGRIYAPLDFVVKSIGKSYSWDPKTKTAYIGLSKNEIENGLSVNTSDGLAKLSFPKGWQDAGASGQITLNYSTGNSEVMVLRDSKSSLSDTATINDYCEIISNNMSQRLENPAITEPTAVKINNYSALEFEIQGEAQKVKLKYLVAILETSDSYYQLIAFTTQDLYEKSKSNFIKIINTFQEVTK